MDWERVMHCYLHPDNEAIGLCSNCGRFVCETCQVDWQDRIICSPCADKVIPKNESDSIPAVIVSIKPEKLATKLPTRAPEPVTKISIPPSISDFVPKPKSVRVKKPARKKSQVQVPENRPFVPPAFSLKTLGSMFSLSQNYSSTFTIATLVISFFLLLALFVLPWAIAGGFSIYLATANSVLTVFCSIFLVLYLGATFIYYNGIRSLIQIICALFSVLLWLIFVVTTFQEISQFSISPGDMLGPGSMMFIASSILGLIIGILEIHLSSKDFWPRVLETFGLNRPK
jgi:hypothetical protein